MKLSSARPTYSAWPLPRRARSRSSGAPAALAAMATEPSSWFDGAPERLHHRGAVGHGAGGERRDHLGVGGDLLRDPERLADLEVGEVVHVAVQHRGDVGPAVLSISSELRGWALGWEMMPTLAQRVWPSTTASTDSEASACLRSGSRDDGLAEGAGVVAQLTDLRRRLVDEAQMTLGRPHRERAEERVGRPGVEHGAQRRRGEIETVAPDEQVEPGAVATANLEPIDGRERLVHGEPHGRRRPDRHPGPPGLVTPSAARRRSRRTAHTASLSAISAALTRSRSGPPSEMSASRRRSRPCGLPVEAVDQVGDRRSRAPGSRAAPARRRRPGGGRRRRRPRPPRRRCICVEAGR